MSALTSRKTSPERNRANYLKRKEIARQASLVSVQVRQEKAKARRKTELQVEKQVKKIQLAQAETVARAMMLPAVGVNYIYKIITHKDERGRVGKREHVLIESPIEIAHALDAISNSHGKDDDDENLFYYVSVEKPDFKAGEAILNRAIGKTPDKVAHSGKVDHVFSLGDLAKARKALPPHVQENPFDELPAHLEARVIEPDPEK